jgi:6-pyruvoyl-tetrahydropterin synthase
VTDYHPSVERSFDAGHDRLEHFDSCRHDGHGHRWRVRVTAFGAFDPRAGRSYRTDELERDLDTLVMELEGKNLSKMMPGAIPTPEGLGLWIIEKLVADHPKIIEVEIWLDPQHKFSLTREPR